MKLQRVRAYDYNGRSQYKYLITIPEEMIQSLGWKAGSELKATLKGKGIQISFVAKPRTTRKYKETKMTYGEFRDKIHSSLEHKDNGMTWSDIREQLGLSQIVPNNKWVRRLEKDIGLKRVRDSTGIIWRVTHV